MLADIQCNGNKNNISKLEVLMLLLLSLHLSALFLLQQKSTWRMSWFVTFWSSRANKVYVWKEATMNPHSRVWWHLFSSTLWPKWHYRLNWCCQVKVSCTLIFHRRPDWQVETMRYTDTEKYVIWSCGLLVRDRCHLMAVHLLYILIIIY